MMKRKFTRQNLRKNSIRFIILLFLFGGFASCSNKRNNNLCGFMLQRFEVINPQLDSIIQKAHDSTYIKLGFIEPEKSANIMILRIYDSVPEFCLTSADKDEVSKMYIFQNNRRIVGYIDVGDFTIIVLSTENNQFDFEWTFYKFLIPTKDTKQFDYIYFPDDQYYIDEYGLSTPPPFFDPCYYCFAFKNGRFSDMKYY